MSDPYALLTSAFITNDEFFSFLTEVGGVLDPGRPGKGQVSRGSHHIWAYFGPEVLADGTRGIEDAIAEKLGAPARSCVILEISHNPGSLILAVDFAVDFAERWPAIVCDPEDQLLDLADLKRLQREGKGFGSDPGPAPAG
jgi:hypothetical protein